MLKALQQYLYVSAFVTVFILAGLLITSIVFPSTLSLVLLGSGFTLTIIIFQLILWSNLRKHIDVLSRQVNSVQAIGSLQSIELQYPSFLLTHSVAPDVLMLMGEFIRRFPIQQVLELGSGASSLYLTTMLDRFKGSGTLMSFEDSKDWRDLVQKEIDTVLSKKQVTCSVIYAPLTPTRNSKGDNVLFYSLPAQFLEKQNKFDMVFIDGPADVQYRIFALEALIPYFSQDCILIWDDGEQAVIRTNVEAFVSKNSDWSFKYYDTVKGTCVLYRLSSHLPLP